MDTVEAVDAAAAVGDAVDGVAAVATDAVPGAAVDAAEDMSKEIKQ
jgi:hypothetical protein